MKDTRAGETRGGRLVRTLAILAGGMVLILGALGLWVATHGRAFVLAELSHRLGRPVHVDGELSVKPSLHSVTIRFSRLHVDQAVWAGPGSMLQIDRGVVTAPWTGLLGSVRLQDVELEGPRLTLRRDAKGRPNWSDGRPRPPPRLPRIARITLRDGLIDYQDLSRTLSFRGAITVAPNAAGTPVLSVAGGGRSEDGTWTTQVRSTTDFSGSTPYVLSGRLAVDRPSGHSDVRFSGRLQPGGAGRFLGELDGSGPDLHDIAHVINVPLPRTPAYRLHARLERRDHVTRLYDMAGRVGASDLEGVMTVTLRPNERRVDGVLHSRSLRMADLFSVVSNGHLSRANIKPGHFLPDTPVNPVPLRKLTGVIRLNAASVQAPTIPVIRSLQLVATFDHGRLGAAPMTLDLPHGRGVVRFLLDVRGAVPKVRLDVDLRHADSTDFRKSGGAQPPLQASFDGAIHVQGVGPSLSAAAAHAYGDIRLRASGGELKKPQAAVLSGDLLQGAASLLGGGQAQVPLKCAVAGFSLHDGQARVTTLRLATSLGSVAGSGGFDLASESVDLTLRPGSAGAAKVSAVRIAGPMTHPTAKLTMGSPVAVVGHVVSGLLRLGATTPPSPSCG